MTGSVNEELLRRNAYLVAENRILRQQIAGRVHLTAAESKTPAEIGKKLGRRALEEVTSLVAGVTPHPDQQWMMQIACNVSMIEWGLRKDGSDRSKRKRSHGLFGLAKRPSATSSRQSKVCAGQSCSVHGRCTDCLL